jgi:hypothetical protein
MRGEEPHPIAEAMFRAESELLQEYDSYFYSRGNQLPLPILRVKFADADKTWVYADLEHSQVVPVSTASIAWSAGFTTACTVSKKGSDLC